MKTEIKHCLHINPITNKRYDTCPIFYRSSKGGCHRTPKEKEILENCIPMGKSSGCLCYED